ncbi:cytochrome P450 9e2-like [Sitophilus oryzae]|uniref:Cytochrome P450 9e2-like n=1 Tax=Sitophilus oryzae TaxID=7048 RepID=A0A6J2YMJ7_SITOR|nr:cytochrome P450 9e2-like [Sitophilus oryzae]
MLRKWPPIIAKDRICTKPYTLRTATKEEKDIEFKVDDMIWIPTHAIHRCPENYPNPEKFDPERFSDENKGNIKPYTYLPFGVGSRNCIGSRFALLEVKVLLFKILLNFELIPTAKTIIPLKVAKGGLNHTAEGGFWFGLKRIQA